jgi:hypothetical protein
MARNVTNLQVVVGYPDDVAEERAIVDEVVDELNLTWSRTLGIKIELIDWKTHSFPNFGSDSQAVINEEFGDDYDIFLGIMWMKFGEPTPRAESGTAEEFQRALQRFKDKPERLRIMFYFKDAGPQSLKQIDTEQLNLIRNFKKLVAAEGGLYFEFKDGKQFASAIRMHLSRQVQEYGKTWGCEPADTPVTSIEASTRAASDIAKTTGTSAEEEEGFLDLIERSVDEFGAAAEILGRMTEAQTLITSQIQERTSELNDLNKANADVKQRKRVLNNIAETMDQYSSALEEGIPRLSSHYSAAVDATTRAISIWSEDFGSGQEQAASAYEQLESMFKSLNEYLPAVVSMRAIVSSMPRVTSDFNRSKRRLTSAIDSLSNEIEREMDLGNQLMTHFQNILGREADSAKPN